MRIKKSNLAIAGGVAIGVGSSYILRRYGSRIIPFLPLPSPWNRIDTFGLGLAGGIATIFGLTKKARYPFLGFGITAVLGSLINAIYPAVPMASFFQENLAQKTGITAIGRGQREFRSDVAGLDPQSRERLEYKEMSVTSPAVMEAPASPGNGWQSQYTIQSTEKGPDLPEQEQIATLYRGLRVLA